LKKAGKRQEYRPSRQEKHPPVGEGRENEREHIKTAGIRSAPEDDQKKNPDVAALGLLTEVQSAEGKNKFFVVTSRGE